MWTTTSSIFFFVSTMGVLLALTAATSKVVCAIAEDGTMHESCEVVDRYEQMLGSVAADFSSGMNGTVTETLDVDVLQNKLGLKPMPLFERVPWSAWDQWKIVIAYVVFIGAIRKFVIEKLWETTWDRIQMRKILVGTLMVYDIMNHLSFDSTGMAVYPVWAEIAMVIENFILLRKELMTSPSKWAHDILLLVSFVLVTQGFYFHAPEKVYSRKWMHLHGSLFYGAWMLESVFLFCNHKKRRPTMNRTFMKIFLAVTICCCLHNIIFLLGHAWFVFYDTVAPLAIAVGFSQQWSLWTYKIYTKGVR